MKRNNHCSELLDRETPRDLNAERVVLYAMIVHWGGPRHDTITASLAKLPPELFASEWHRNLFLAVQRGVQERKPLFPSSTSIVAWLRGVGAIGSKDDAVFGSIMPEEYLIARILQNPDILWLNAYHDLYLNRLEKMARLRHAVEISLQLVQIAYNGGYDSWKLAICQASHANRDDSTICRPGHSAQ